MRIVQFPKSALWHCRWLLFYVVAAAAVLGFSGCGDVVDNPVQPEDDLRQRFGLQTLPEISYPENNRPRQERIALGRLQSIKSASGRRFRRKPGK